MRSSSQVGQPMRTPRRRRALLVAGALVVLGAGCGSGDDGSSAPTVDVVTQVGGQLAEVGILADPGSLTCDDELEASKGESVTCEFASEGQPVGLVATVVDVDGDDADLAVETEARAVPADTLEEQVRLRIEQAMGSAALTSTECEGDLEPAVDASTTCSVSDGTTTRSVEVTVTAVDGGLVEFAIAEAI